ncbi:Na+/H+ antiporter [Chitinophaga tropicalis]|uniref:Na+/H+ antiporter n=1 Tax=Chitinophaga tropicalis TaxID=2683588 RepID=A0A7K1U6L5_9BACT|nr:Na+/H+ antiporter [Chitinophaga tropicalis]MVT09989.1 Na+/H+ antiporter [Chitinophaga tropicalis]
MENYSIIIFVLTLMIGLSAMADKMKLSYPILLIAAGIAIGFIPHMPVVELNPDVIFLIFLPPLLYDAAFNISFKDFKTHAQTIGTLAIGLVFLTTIAIAVLAHYLIPGMTWPLAFVLGSILSATDAVAAIGITKGLGLSHKTTTILEGESLVNDASALVAYRFAVAAVTGVSFVLWRASVQFLALMLGGFLVGAVAAKLLSFILKRVHSNAMVAISFMLIMPFVTYLLAEELHVSGVIAVVTLGLGISRFSKMVFPEGLKIQNRSIWEIIIFLLNGLIFIIIGLAFPFVLRDMDKTQVLPYLGYAAMITVATLLLRMVRVFLQRVNLQRAFLSRKRKVAREALLDFQTSVIISWSGMRGIVSLAIAIGLPVTLTDGTPFPQRTTIIFISIAVVVFTLLGQGLTLPWIVKQMGRLKK